VKTGRLTIRVQRVYEHRGRPAGACFLVDRLWPRGVKKSAIQLDGWLKDVAPSDSLRRWYGHDPERWDEFVERYFAELDAKPDAWRPLLDAARAPEGVTLLFAKRDIERNNAVALKRYLELRHRETE
jgi:uncharacterized protein YeaO (DUF488 family)